MSTLERLIQEMLDEMELAGVVERKGLLDGEPLYAFTPLADSVTEQFGDDAEKEIARIARERGGRAALTRARGEAACFLTDKADSQALPFFRGDENI